MKIAVLQSSYDGSTAPFKDWDPYINLNQFYSDDPKRHEITHILIKKATASQQIRDLSREKYDAIINLCDGSFDEDRAGMEVVQLLEKYNLPFTGSGSIFYEPSKEMQKMVAYYQGVQTPNFTFAFNDEDIENALKTLNFPMLIKHYNGYSSIGMSKDSRVTNKEDLYVMARKMIQEFEGALIEEFIEGREFAVMVLENPDNNDEPIPLIPVECKFSNGETFKHFDVKWKECGNIDWYPLRDEPELARKMQDMTKKMFVALGGTGYGRADIRVNSKGEAYYLEINPNCGILYGDSLDKPETLGSADFILLQDDKWNHVKFIDHIIKCAIRRVQLRTKKFAVRFMTNIGYAMFAAVNIKQGEIIKQYEERGIYVATKGHVKRDWKDPLRISWFERYAYPITDEIYATWSENPNEWSPINHSCDPNGWLVGLNFVARRDIKKGEQITMDYATFCCDNMETFNCSCKSSNCRNTITGTDYLLPFVGELYSGHTSDYVETKRKQHQQIQKTSITNESNGHH